MTRYFSIDDEEYEAFEEQFGYTIEDSCEGDLVEFLEAQGIRNVDTAEFRKESWFIVYEVVGEKTYAPEWKNDEAWLEYRDSLKF